MQKKKKMLWFWIALVLGVLGAVGWLGYILYFGSDKNTPVDIASNIIISENSKNEKSESNTKAKSLMDQELAKQKIKTRVLNRTRQTRLLMNPLLPKKKK